MYEHNTYLHEHECVNKSNLVCATLWDKYCARVADISSPYIAAKVPGRVSCLTLRVNLRPKPAPRISDRSMTRSGMSACVPNMRL